MNPDERQVAPTLEGIRRDHTARYEFAASRLPDGSRVIDAACGVGYGSLILAREELHVAAFDCDEEALAYAREHYADERIAYATQDLAACASFEQCDAAVCFETIEHIEDPRPLLRSLRAAPLLIASVPNEDAMPWRRADGSTTQYHFRHYTKAQFTVFWNRVDGHAPGGTQCHVQLLELLPVSRQGFGAWGRHRG